MELLKERIRREGKVLPGNIIKVDGFLNHRVDTKLLEALADEFAKYFDISKITMVLTAEASGIALATICAQKYGVPMLFAKKAKSDNIEGGLYQSEVFSYTYKKKVTLIVSHEWLHADDHVLIIDDFMAKGYAMQGLIDLVNAAGATLEGIGVAVEKGFQGGGDKFRASGQYNLLVARRVRECGVYCEIKPYTMSMDDIRAFDPAAIIFTGGPATVFEPNAPALDNAIFELGLPILGICYGQQLMIHQLGGACRRAEVREYGKVELTHDGTSLLFDGVEPTSICWMSHGVEVERLSPGFRAIAHTAGCAYAAIENADRKLYGVQFHPEVLHTVHGTEILKDFLYKVCGLAPEWSMANYVSEAIEEVRAKVGSGKVLLALSGGVDSAVAAALLYRAVGEQLTCIFVDHGLLRKDEGDQVERAMHDCLGMRIVRVNAQERFLTKLAGISEPERKRKIIGEEFIRVFEAEAKKLGRVDFLAQGTIYPDVVESGVGGESVVIKSHHNVGGLPDHVDFKEIIEPLRRLFKDEVRQLGIELGLPESLVWRQPFPGPGLAIRVIGDITEEKLHIVREADAIFREEVAKAGLERSINQYFAALTNLRSVGVMGDERTYDYAIALRAVETQDFMTADFSRLPWELLDTVSRRIVNEVKGVNRILYDVTSKPPATVELE